jgi:hypothetical protein
MAQIALNKYNLLVMALRNQSSEKKYLHQSAARLKSYYISQCDEVAQ